MFFLHVGRSRSVLRAERSKRARLWNTAVVASALLGLFGCPMPQQRSVTEATAEIMRDHTTKSAFLCAEPLLTSLKPGQQITFHTLNFHFYTLRSWLQGTIGGVAAADGWISAFSGGYAGAADGFGRLFARSSDKVYGRHIFGYVWNQTIVPCYELTTAALSISEAEYQQLQKQGDKDIGERPTETGAHLYYKQIRMYELHELPFKAMFEEYKEPEVTFKEVSKEEFKQALFAVYTKESFDKAAAILGGIPPGSDTWGVVKALDGRFKTLDYGEVYTLFMNGYANYGGDHRLFKVAPSAIFEVWPYGFVQDKTDMFRLVAIFRNGKLLKVVPYAPREELERTLVD